MLRRDHAVEIGPGANCVALETALELTPFPASAGELGSLLRAYVGEIPDAVIRAIALRPGLLGHDRPGVVGPLGVLSGIVCASVARASYTARVKSLESIVWSRMFRLFRGLPPASREQKVSDEKSPKGLARAVRETMIDRLRGLAPAQPDDQNRVWGVDLVARQPAFGGKASQTAAGQSGYRVPRPVKKEECPQSGAYLAPSNYDAPLTVPDVQNAEVGPGVKDRLPQVEDDAVVLRELFQSSFEDNAPDELVGNMTRYASSYELERGFKRSSPRLATAFF